MKLPIGCWELRNMRSHVYSMPPHGATWLTPWSKRRFLASPKPGSFGTPGGTDCEGGSSVMRAGNRRRKFCVVARDPLFRHYSPPWPASTTAVSPAATAPLISKRSHDGSRKRPRKAMRIGYGGPRLDFQRHVIFALTKTRWSVATRIPSLLKRDGSIQNRCKSHRAFANRAGVLPKAQPKV